MPATDAGPRPDVPGLPDAGPPEDLDGFIAHHMAAGGIPGLAVAIVTPDDVAWTGTYGFADIEAERPVDASTLFIMASVSKTFSAVRALQLVEAGLLDLDANVEDYVDFAVRHPEHPDAVITTRMLLTHTSGLADNFPVLGSAGSVGDSPVALAAFAEGYVTPDGAYWSESNWDSAPGTRRDYANAGFGVVGHVLEGAGGAGFAPQTETAIFEPLLMDGAGWFLADVDAARLAVPYGWGGRRFTPLPHNGFAYYPATSLRVSLTGLGRYARMLLRGGELLSTRVLSEASVDELFRIQVPEVSGGQALSFSQRTVGGHGYIGHSGATYGGSTELLLSRDRTFAILVITNSDAYVRARVGLTDGEVAMDEILARLNDEALALR